MYCHLSPWLILLRESLEHLACIHNTSHQADTRDSDIHVSSHLQDLVVMLCNHLLSCCCNECKEWARPAFFKLWSSGSALVVLLD
jgi:hypothetical protein